MAQSELGSIARHSGIYFLGNLLNRSASFILLPLYLNVLSPTEFGWLSVVLAAMEVLALVLGLGLGAAMVRLLVECKTRSEIGTVIGSTLVFFLIPSLVVLILAWPGSQLVAHLVSAAGMPAELFFLGFVTAIFTVVFEITLSVYRGLKMSWLYTMLSSGKSALFLTLNTIFLLVFDRGVTGILLGTIVSVCILTIYSFWWFYRQYSLSVSRTVMARLARIGFPIVPGAFLDAAFSAMDKFYLAAFVEPTALGVYALAARLAQLLRFTIAVPFAQIWTVRRLEIETTDTEATDQAVFSNALLGFLMIFLLASLFICLFSPEIIWVIGRDDYLGAAEFVPYAIGGLFFFILKWNFEIGIFASEKTIRISAISLIVLAVAVPLYGIIVPRFGAKGAAIVFVALGALRTVLTAMLAANHSSVVRTFPILGTAILATAAVAVYVGIVLSVGPLEPFLSILPRALALALFAGISAILVMLRQNMYRDLRSALPGKGTR